jgi:hypothetical protein
VTKPQPKTVLPQRSQRSTKEKPNSNLTAEAAESPEETRREEFQVRAVLYPNVNQFTFSKSLESYLNAKTLLVAPALRAA